MSRTERLVAMEGRIERLSDSTHVFDATFVRIFRPLLRRVGYEPRLVSSAAMQLLSALASCDDPGALSELLPHWTRAVAELESNIVRVERRIVLQRSPQMALAAWLGRLHGVLLHVARHLDASDGDSSHARLAQARAPLALPPLDLRPTSATSPDPPEDAPSRALGLASVDHLVQEAVGETELLDRRRRLFESARQLLLDADAALPLDPEGVALRRDLVTAEMVRIDRLLATGISGQMTITQQLRQAVSRGERERLFALLVAKHDVALRGGDRAGMEAANRALGELSRTHDTGTSAEARRRSRGKSAEQMFGPEFVKQAKDVYARARARGAQLLEDGDDPKAAQRGRWMTAYFTESAHEQLLLAQISVDGLFEVGGALVPTRIEEVETRLRAVRFPTPDLLLLPATDASEIPDAHIDDPRTILIDLAAGRLLARRFVHEDRTVRPRTVLRGQARVYVLDGSGSMVGPRARVRDALVAAELLTLRKRCYDRKFGKVTFFYRYFDEHVHPVTRVETPAQVDLALEDVLGTLRTGGTDIEAALLESLDLVANACASDPDLAHAQLVLVTDGKATVSMEKVASHRAAIRIPVSFSVIALGEENEALRRLVAHQRARGERAFYHYVSDDALAHMLERDGQLPLHAEAGELLPAEELASKIGDLVEELATLGRVQDWEALEMLDHRASARDEVGLDSAMGEGERARARALYRDRRALDRQFAFWFPEPSKNEPALDPTTWTASDVEAVVVLLRAVVDVVLVVQGSELYRRSDAIALLERLLSDARLTPARYRAVVAAPPAPVSDALSALHLAVVPP